MEKEIFKSISHHRVLYADTDQMSIVYNANYFIFFELSRGDYLRNKNLNYKEIEEKGLMMPLIEAFAHYYQPFEYDDIIEIECTIAEIRRASFRFEYNLYLKGEPNDIRVKGYTVHATVDKNRKLTAIPSWLKKILEDK